jgi:hypothetical protein
MADAQYERRTAGNEVIYDIRPAGLLKRTIYANRIFFIVTALSAVAAPLTLLFTLPFCVLSFFSGRREMRKRKPALVTIDNAGVRFGSNVIKHQDIAGLAIENNYGNSAIFAPRTAVVHSATAAAATGAAYEARAYSLVLRIKNSSKRLMIVYGLTEAVADDLMAEMMADLNRN